MVIQQAITTPVGPVEKVSSVLSFRDKIGALSVRLGLGRYSYTVVPGLYALGNPTADSPVLVTANYKLTFDSLRKELAAIDAWILVLDTKGINVWCAAGKGTFGTAEAVSRINLVQLEKLVSHRKLIFPQLGAVGVAAHSVKFFTGFTAVFGPVRAQDIPAFLRSGLRATAEMRRVAFSFYDRLVLVPMEIRIGLKYLVIPLLLFYIISGFSKAGFSLHTAWEEGSINALILFGALFSGSVLGPLLLPWLPGRSFSSKGFFAGAIMVVFLLATGAIQGGGIEIFTYAALVTSIASFATMNFTGASTYTSLSGVRKEMKKYVPLQLAGAVMGLMLFIVRRFI